MKLEKGYGAMKDRYLFQANVVNRLLEEYERYGRIIVAYDFDSTVFDYHGNGDTFGNVMKLIRDLKPYANFIVYTCRPEKQYDEIKEYLDAHDLPYDTINEPIVVLNGEDKGSKLFYSVLLDDRAGLFSVFTALTEVVNILNERKREKEIAERTAHFKTLKDDIVQWIRDYFEKAGGKGAVIGISGGKDSTVVAGLLVEALGVDRVCGVLMPNGTQKDIQDSKRVVDILGINSDIVNIGNAYDKLVSEMGYSIFLTDEAKINIAPRLRMTVLYAIGQTLGYRVAGTGNACEAYVGYCTKWGDTAHDFNPIAELTVDEVIGVGMALGLPHDLLLKAPADGLSGSTDEERLGVTYAQIAEVRENGTCGNEEADANIKTKHLMSLHKFEPIPHYSKKQGEWYEELLSKRHPLLSQ